ncbi:MAG: hypothetical protein ACXWLM_02605, partial [Myxococcales bacterium]
MRFSIWLFAAALACTPGLSGTCSADADCKAGESCSSAGICLRSGTNPDDGSGAIDVLSPAAGAFVRGSFHVAAQASTGGSVRGVGFVVTDRASGAVIGQANAAGPAVNVWSADVTLDAASFGGGAEVRAVLHRDGQSDLFSSGVAVIVDQNGPSIAPAWDQDRWFALSAPLSLAATVADDRSGLASAALRGPGGGTTQGAIAGGSATFQLQAADLGTAGAAVAVSLTLLATDVAGNQTLVPGGRVRVDDEPPVLTVDRLDPVLRRTGILAFGASLDDGAGAGPAAVTLLINGTAVAGQPSAGGAFSLVTDLEATAPATEGVVQLQVVGTDAVGNEAAVAFDIAVDTIAPAVADARIESPPEVTDLAGTGWFRGPSIAPAGGDIRISAVVSDTNLISAVAVAGGHEYPGTPSNGRFFFSIPRSEGLGAAGAVEVTFDAEDAAGNHPGSSPILPVFFDDQQTLPATAANDAVVHGPAETVAVSVSAAPPSGFPLSAGAVNLAAAGALSIGACGAIAPDASSTFLAFPAASTLVFEVPIACAPAGTEGPVTYAVALHSLAGGAGAASGSINVETKGPIAGDVVVNYPPAAGGAPLGWSHDGDHFHRRDSGALVSFAAYDCHGLADALPAVSGLPGATVSKAVDTRGVLTPSTCPDPAAVVVQRYTITADLAVVPTASLTQADNALAWSAQLANVFGVTSNATGSLNVTRRLWRTTLASATNAPFLVLGPRLFAVQGFSNMASLDPATGVESDWERAEADPLVAPNGNAPAIVYPRANLVIAGNAASAVTAELGSCSHGDLLTGYALAGPSDVIFSSQSQVWDGTCSCRCPNFVPCELCFQCQNLVTQSFVDTLHLSGGGASCVAGGSAPAPRCNGSPNGPASLTNRVSSASPPAFVGLSGGNTWVLTDAAGTPRDSIGGLSGPNWPLIDGSNPPIVYLTGMAGTPGRVETRVIAAGPAFGPAPFALPLFQFFVFDLVLGANG